MNGNAKKGTIIVVICIIFFSCILSSEKKQKDDIYIYYTGDVHCAITENIGYSSLSAIVKKERSEHKFVTLVDLGDFLQDNAKNSNEDNSISSLTKGKAMIEIMNAVGYDIVTIGNHEFDFGLEAMKSNLSLLNSEITVCNFEYLGKQTDYFNMIQDYVIKDYDGTKVAYIGVISPETDYKVDKTIIKDENGNNLFNLYEDNNGEALYKRVQDIVNSINKEVDYIVVLSHLGNENKEGYSSVDLIKNTYGIDILLDSHSHYVMENEIEKNKFDKDVIVCSSGKSLNNIGKIILTKEHNIETSLIKGYDSNNQPIVYPDDKQVVKVIKDIYNRIYGIEE